MSSDVLNPHEVFRMAQPADFERPGRRNDDAPGNSTTTVFKMAGTGGPLPAANERSADREGPGPKLELTPRDRDTDPVLVERPYSGPLPGDPGPWAA
jgi:hypothetical protein